MSEWYGLIKFIHGVGIFACFLLSPYITAHHIFPELNENWEGGTMSSKITFITTIIILWVVFFFMLDIFMHSSYFESYWQEKFWREMLYG